MILLQLCGSSCSTVAELTPRYHQFVGLNPARAWAFSSFLFFLYLSLGLNESASGCIFSRVDVEVGTESVRQMALNSITSASPVIELED